MIRAAYVELGTVRRPSSVKGNHLGTQEVLAIFNAAGDRERYFAFVRDEGIDGPGVCRRVESIFVYLEPLQASHISLSCTGNLSSKNSV